TRPSCRVERQNEGLQGFSGQSIEILGEPTGRSASPSIESVGPEVEPNSGFMSESSVSCVPDSLSGEGAQPLSISQHSDNLSISHIRTQPSLGPGPTHFKPMCSRSLLTKSLMFKNTVSKAKNKGGSLSRRKGVLPPQQKRRARRGKLVGKKALPSPVPTQITGISIGDSNIQNMNKLFLQKIQEEATDIWKMGKQLGVSFPGDYLEVIDHLGQLEIRDISKGD
ncbi:hypothetical protein Ancab_014501, partial [Ancistrocladus abbreviatus]